MWLFQFTFLGSIKKVISNLEIRWSSTPVRISSILELDRCCRQELRDPGKAKKSLPTLFIIWIFYKRSYFIQGQLLLFDVWTSARITQYTHAFDYIMKQKWRIIRKLKSGLTHAETTFAHLYRYDNNTSTLDEWYTVSKCIKQYHMQTRDSDTRSTPNR